MPKRQWKEWWPRFKSEATGTSGVAGLGGGLAAGAGGVAVTGPVGAAVGLIVFGGATIYCAIKSIPPTRISPEELVWTNVQDVSSLNNLTRDILKVGIIGEHSSGKSTLISYLFQDGQRPAKTSRISAWILRTLDSREEVFALIDGAGEDLAQQFAVCLASDLVILVADHNAQENSGRVVADRLHAHKVFAEQVRNILRGEAKLPMKFIVYLNKHDRWASVVGATDVQQLGSEIQKIVSDVLPVDKIEVKEHSNFDQNRNIDCASDISEIAKRWREGN